MKHPPFTIRRLCVALTAFVALPAGAAEDGRYRITPSDVLQIVVFRDTEVSATVPVRPDGMISLALVDDVPAAGLTPMELRDVLTKRLSSVLSSPRVSVIVTQIHGFKVSVVGKVKRPDRYDLQAPATVLEILAQAGGLDDYARADDIYVLRSAGGKTERIPAAYRALLSADTEPLYLRPNDVVIVP
jgi:polysaccharide export outer membrane protein